MIFVNWERYSDESVGDICRLRYGKGSEGYKCKLSYGYECVDDIM